MKKIIAVILSLVMVMSFAACSAQKTGDENPATNETTQAANAGELQMGVYTGTAIYTSGEFSMTWNMIIDFNEDNTFVLNNEKGEEKGSGSYALTDS